VYAVVEPALVRAPQDTAVKQDSQVTMKCSSNVSRRNFITWFNTLCATYDRDTNDCIRVYNGYSSVKYRPRFSVTKVNNATHVTRDLDINPTQLTDAGVYVCVENRPGHGVQQTRSAQLIVVGNYITSDGMFIVSLHEISCHSFVYPMTYVLLICVWQHSSCASKRRHGDNGENCTSS